MSHVHRHAAFAASLLVASSMVAPAARAQSDASSRALAVELFDQAETLFGSGRTAEACPKYAESLRLDPQLGVMIYLAECYEKNGQISSAWGSFRAAEEMAAKRGDERQAHVHERAAALAPRVDHLIIVVPAAARVPGLEISSDGLPIAETLWGNGAAIDAGSHRIQARAPGYKPWQAEVQIAGEGTSSTLDVPKLTADPLAGPRTERSADSGNTRRMAAIAVGGVGLVALGVGGFFGLSAQSSYSDSKSSCNDDNFCTPQGKDLRDSAKHKALVSTIASGVGVAALGTAAVLWFTAPSKPEGAKVARSSPRQRWSFGPSTSSWGVEAQGAF